MSKNRTVTDAYTHYDTLELAEHASAEAIRGAYKFLSQKWHPDRNAGDFGAARKSTEINVAYLVLSDPAKKATYDAELTALRKKTSDEVEQAAAARSRAEATERAARKKQGRARAAEDGSFEHAQPHSADGTQTPPKGESVRGDDLRDSEPAPADAMHASRSARVPERQGRFTFVGSKEDRWQLLIVVWVLSVALPCALLYNRDHVVVSVVVGSLSISFAKRWLEGSGRDLVSKALIGGVAFWIAISASENDRANSSIMPILTPTPDPNSINPKLKLGSSPVSARTRLVSNSHRHQCPWKPRCLLAIGSRSTR